MTENCCGCKEDCSNCRNVLEIRLLYFSFFFFLFLILINFLIFCIVFVMKYVACPFKENLTGRFFCGSRYLQIDLAAPFVNVVLRLH